MSLSDEQKKLRLSGIGGSEIASIVGLNPYAGPLDVYRAKVEGHVVPVTAPMERGIFLEAGVAEWYAHRTKAVLRETGTIAHPSIKLAICTPDRLARFQAGNEIDVSIKVPGPHVREQWGEPGTDDVPEQYIIQVQWELLILSAREDIHRAQIVAPLDGDLAIYNVVADADIQGFLIEAAQFFWKHHVEAKRPPPVDATDSSAEWLKSRFPRQERPMLEATKEAHELMAGLKDARERKDAAEKDETLCKNRLKDLCGLHEGILGTGWKLTWRTTKDSIDTDWQSVASEMGASNEVIQKYTRPKPGVRRFLPQWEKKK